MKALKFTAVALALMAMPVAAQAGESRPHMPKPGWGGGTPHMPKPGMGGVRHWGGKHNGRWVGGWRAPGGWGAYRRPFVGYALPRYWIQPSFYLGNYWNYGFSRPAYGYGWSRYYDDAVLTDRYGRVHDYVPNVAWDRYDRYDDNYAYSEDYRDSYGYGDDGYRRRGGATGLGGAIAGGAVGAIAGGLIAKRGDNTEGAIAGGVLGAVAGAAIESSSKKRKRLRARDEVYARPIYQDGGARIPYDYGMPAGDAVSGNGHWSGTWTGSYNGGPTQSWSGTYSGGYDGVTGGGYQVADGWQNEGPRGAGYPAPQVQAPAQVYQHGGVYQSGGYGYGYGAPGVTTVTVQSQPVVTTTTTEIIEETVYTQATRKRYAPKRVVRAKPKPKPRCVCKVVYR